MKIEISKLSKWLLIISGIFLAVSIVLPIWRIELDAPQYPEGLGLQIFSYKLGGDVAIINGLNHYIGMQTLHEENFIELDADNAEDEIEQFKSFLDDISPDDFS